MTCGRGYQCAECGEHFGSLRTFDVHRLDLERCMTPAQMRRRGLRQKAGGFWTDEAPMGSERQLSLGLRRGRPRNRPRKIRGEALRRRIRSGKAKTPGSDETPTLALPPQAESGLV